MICTSCIVKWGYFLRIWRNCFWLLASFWRFPLPSSSTSWLNISYGHALVLERVSCTVCLSGNSSIGKTDKTLVCLYVVHFAFTIGSNAKSLYLVSANSICTVEANECVLFYYMIMWKVLILVTFATVWLDILYDSWSPAMTVSSICISILSMLSSSTVKVLS